MSKKMKLVFLLLKYMKVICRGVFCLHMLVYANVGLLNVNVCVKQVLLYVLYFLLYST